MEIETSSRLEKVERKLQQENASEKYRSVQVRVQDLEAYSRKCNLEITGIYEYPNEDLKEILSQPSFVVSSYHRGRFWQCTEYTSLKLKPLVQ